jgi:hypothetical protein
MVVSKLVHFLFLLNTFYFVAWVNSLDCYELMMDKKDVKGTMEHQVPILLFVHVKYRQIR